MAAALYEPGLGYYSNGLTPFGEQGDFVTAPESGGLFGRCLAQCIASVLTTLSQGVVLELGAGSGVLAADLLSELQRLDCLPERYYILERSAAMRAMQEDTLARRIPELAGRMEWLTELPAQPVSGVIFGNEVADALPVKRFCWSDARVTEIGVAWQDDRLSDCESPGNADFQARVQILAQGAGWSKGYSSEYCPSLPAWIGSLADCLAQGLLLMIDYGYGRAEYYHPQRNTGTLICHYRHNAHNDPYFYPGLQDITAFVDFTAIAEAASDGGMQLKGYTSQAQFLVGCGIDRLLAEGDPDDARRFLQLSNEAKRLLLPGEMGERFKAIGFVRDVPDDVKGFSARDLRSRL
ncbi:MAG TPA: SAM-dependent methyltransferase [Gammaproteobacteria bacterium]|nr:SAM-dependent methyltransferase [Gammaproteobacteria bacterium]